MRDAGRHLCEQDGCGLTIERCDIVNGVVIGDGFTWRVNHLYAVGGGCRNVRDAADRVPFLHIENTVISLWEGNGTVDGDEIP